MARKPRQPRRPDHKLAEEKPEEQKRPRGNQTKWRPEFVDIARRMTQCGCPMEEIAEKLGVASSTFWEWKLEHADLAEAIKDWKDYADLHVEAALFKSAKGFFQKIEKVMTSGGRVFVQSYIEYYPPSNTAQIFWLKNRKPQDWRENRELTLKKAIDPDADPIGDLAASIAALADKIAGDESE